MRSFIHQLAAILLLVGTSALLRPIAAQTPAQPKPAAPKQGAAPTSQQPSVATSPAVQAPSSKHYPILVVAQGSNPTWSVRVGMKGLERLDRANYPPIILDAAEIIPADAGGSWTYHAKDDVTQADVLLTLTREPCVDPAAGPSAPKATFSAVLVHAQIGTLKGCGQSEPDLFPEFLKKNQIDDAALLTAQTEKEKEASALKAKLKVLDPIKSVAPVNYAFVDAAGKIIVVRGGVRKTAAPAGSEPALSHDGKKLVYTRADSSTSPNRSLVLWEFDTGRSRDLVTGNARSGFFSPDDSRVAFLKYEGSSWHLYILPINAPEKAAQVSQQNFDSLHGWAGMNLLATDMANAYFLADPSLAGAGVPAGSSAADPNRPPNATPAAANSASSAPQVAPQAAPGSVVQTIPLKEIYGDQFQIMSSDTLRAHPFNPDLLVVSAYYNAAPQGAPVDAMSLNQSFFLYELRSHRRTVLGPTDSFNRHAEWSHDGVQVFFTRGVPSKSMAALVLYRILWDSTGLRRFLPGYDLSIGK